MKRIYVGMTGLFGLYVGLVIIVVTLHNKQMDGADLMLELYERQEQRLEDLATRYDSLQVQHTKALKQRQDMGNYLNGLTFGRKEEEEKIKQYLKQYFE